METGRGKVAVWTSSPSPEEVQRHPVSIHWHFMKAQFLDRVVTEAVEASLEEHCGQEIVQVVVICALLQVSHACGCKRK